MPHSCQEIRLRAWRIMGARRRHRVSGFTLVELLIAFAISTMLLCVIWYFFLGLRGMGERGKGKLELNQTVELTMEQLIRDLRMAERVLELRPDRIRFERAAIPKDLPYQHLASSSRRVETVLYRLEKQENNRWHFYRSVGFGDPRRLFEVDAANREIFNGYALAHMPSLNERRRLGERFYWPKLKVFDPKGQDSSLLKRIVLVRISLDLGFRKDKVALVSKIFLPTIYLDTLQKEWNPG